MINELTLNTKCCVRIALDKFTFYSKNELEQTQTRTIVVKVHWADGEDAIGQAT